MKFAYADPPYLGQARKHYGPDAKEVNHRLLVIHLCEDFPDGWALSLSSPTLKAVLNLCPDDVRVGAWVKPFASFKKGVNPAYCWEPVIWRGGRKASGIFNPTVRDFVSANITLEKGVHGAKPPEFARFVFDLLGAKPGDEFVDLFPGSGVMSRVWNERYHDDCNPPVYTAVQGSLGLERA